MDTTAADVARFMLERLDEHGRLDQQVAVREIRARYGDSFVDGWRVARRVLAAFQKLRRGSVTWDGAGWRRR